MVWYINHVFYVFCKGKAESHESNTINIIRDTLCTDRGTEEIPENDETNKTSYAHGSHSEWGVHLIQFVKKWINENEINNNDRHSETFSDTEDEECELCEFFEKCEKEYNNIAGNISLTKWELNGLYETIMSKSISQYGDKITSFNIYLKKEERDFFSVSWILNRPVKWKKNTGDNDNTRKEQCQCLPFFYLPCPDDNTRIDKTTDTNNQ